MALINTTNPGIMTNESALNPDGKEGAPRSFTNPVMTVILKTDPAVMPMVCGICASQFATSRELESHMRVHKPVKKRGRPSLKAKASDPQAVQEVMQCEETDKSSRDGGDQVSQRYEKHALVWSCDGRVPIARLEDYMEPIPLETLDKSIQFFLTPGSQDKIPIHGDQSLTSAAQEVASLPPIQQLTSEQNAPTQSLARTELELSTPDGQITHIEVCFQNFITDTSTNEDDPMTEEGKQKKVCEFCGVTTEAHQMREHMVSTHLGKPEFSCPHQGCVLSFITIPQLRQHLAELHNSKYQVLKSKTIVRSHRDWDPTQPNISCDICNKDFKNRRAHSSHMKMHNKEYLPVACEKCGKKFNHPSALKFHRSMNSDCDKPKYVCDLCGYKAVTPWRLSSHRNQVHSTDRPFNCEFCQKSYKTKEMLKLHMYKLHTGTPTLECDICQKRFFFPAELREHKQLHNTSKDYICPICNRAFKTMHVFRGHMNGKHSDTWYSCGFCKFTTSHKKSMKRHMVLVHKLKNVTLEVTPEIPQSVEVVESDDRIEVIQGSNGAELQLHLSGAHTIQQYDDVVEHVVNTETHVESHIQGLRRAHMATSGGMNANEVSEVLVALSGTLTSTDEGMSLS